MSEQSALIKEKGLIEIPDDLVSAFEKNHYVKAKFFYLNGETATNRLFIKDDIVYVFLKGSRRRGYRLDSYTLEKIKNIEIIKDKQQDASLVWRKKMIEIKTRLENSKLWPEVLKNVNLALEIGYERIQEASHIMDQRKEEDYYANQSKNVDELKAYEPRLVYEHEPGKWCQNTDILWYMTYIPKIKKMNFGTGSTNDYHLNIIKEGLLAKQKIHTNGRTNFDVSFEYDLEKNAAWYSEEFHNCGNGHYYLALDSTHALFYEDD